MERTESRADYEHTEATESEAGCPAIDTPRSESLCNTANGDAVHLMREFSTASEIVLVAFDTLSDSSADSECDHGGVSSNITITVTNHDEGDAGNAVSVNNVHSKTRGRPHGRGAPLPCVTVTEDYDQPTISRTVSYVSDDEYSRDVLMEELSWKDVLKKLWMKYKNPLLLTVVILVLCTLIMLPAIVYHFPTETKSSSFAGMNVSQNISNVTPDCDRGFYLTETEVNNSTAVKTCQPECGEWEEFSRTTVQILDGLRLAGSYVYVVGCAVVLVLSVVLRHRMFKFPSVFVVYLALSLSVLEISFLITYHNQESLFCSSRNLLYSIDHPTTYCTISGVILYYINIQVELLWLFHIIMVFWGIRFPFHQRKFATYRRIKAIHLTMVLAALLLPIVAAGVPFATGGYSLSRFPPDVCLSTDAETFYYVFMLPDSLISAVGVSLLVIILYTVISHVQKDSRQQAAARKTIKLPNPSRLSPIFKESGRQTLEIGAAELKITFICLYFLVFVFIVQVANVILLRNRRNFEVELNDYFTCQAMGEMPGLSCDDSFRRLAPDVLATSAYFVLGFYSPVYLIYVVNITELKKKLRRQ